MIQKHPPEVFYKKSVLKNVAIFTGRHLCWSLFLVKLQTFTSAILLKQTSRQLFSCKCCDIFKNTLFEKRLRTAASGNFLGCEASARIIYCHWNSHKKIDNFHRCEWFDNSHWRNSCKNFKIRESQLFQQMLLLKSIEKCGTCEESKSTQNY